MNQENNEANNYQVNNENQLNDQNLNNNQTAEVEVLNNNNPEKKSYCGFLVIFMIISLCLAGYIVYDKCFKEEKPAGNVNNQANCTSDKVEETKKINPADLKVVDAYVNIDTGDYKDLGIKIPKIEGDTKAINELNNTMMLDSLKTIIDYKDFMVEQMGEVEGNKVKLYNTSEVKNFYDCYKAFDFSYETHKINDVLVIRFNYELTNSKYDEGVCWNASGIEENSIIFYYFYDMKNDKVLSYAEAAEKTNAMFENSSSCHNYSELKQANKELISLVIENNTMKFGCAE